MTRARKEEGSKTAAMAEREEEGKKAGEKEAYQNL